ncbi:hypothetical protein TcCL_NonESM12558, partial [Trypanosoma cruzi]
PLVTGMWFGPSRCMRLNCPFATLRLSWPWPRRCIECVAAPSCTRSRCSLRTMSGTSLADGSLRSSWETGDTTRIRRHGKNACRTESCRPLPLLSVLLGVSEGVVHRRLSALPARHRIQPRLTPRRTVSDVVTPIRDKTARGLSERIAVECGRRRAASRAAPSPSSLSRSHDRHLDCVRRR